MIAIDACVLSLLIYEKSGVPHDFKTKQPIPFARERVDGLIRQLEAEEGSILIPAPALSEALCVVAPDCKAHVEELESQSCFRIRPFGTRAAIEVALRVRAAKDAGDKKEGFRNWDKIKYDRQIVAIAKVEGVEAIYSTDEDIHGHGKLWNIPVKNISDLPIPATQAKLDFDEQKEIQNEPKNPVPENTEPTPEVVSDATSITTSSALPASSAGSIGDTAETEKGSERNT